MEGLHFTPEQVLQQGLGFVGVPWRGRSVQANRNTFKAHYGRNETVLSAVWYDVLRLRSHRLNPEDLDGNFRSFMKANFFLWVYPKNAEIFAAHFGGENEKYCRGSFIWFWIELLADMSRELVLSWDHEYDGLRPDGPSFSWTGDGVEFSAWEEKHPLLNKDKKNFSFKHNRAGFLYLFILESYRDRIAMLIGPVKASCDEISLFREHLKHLIPPGKYIVVDKGMKSGSDATERNLLAFPNPADSQSLKKFKSRLRCRQEHYHARVRKYEALEQIFRHGIDKHKWCVEADCLLIQYDLDLCPELFQG